MPDLISELPQGFMDEFEAEILGRVPDEKIQCQLRQEKIARVMAAAGSVSLDGLGQKVATIDARLYHRMRQSYAKSADDNEWIDDMLKDNPALCAPGYRPGRKGDLRHGITYVGGQAVGAGPHSEKRR